MQDGASSGAGHHARTIGSGIEPPPGARSAAATPLDLLGPDGRAELVATVGASIRGALVAHLGDAVGDPVRRAVRLAAAGAFDGACTGWELLDAGPSWRTGATSSTWSPAETGGATGARTLGDALDLLVGLDGASLRTALRSALVDPADGAVSRFHGRTLDETLAERITGAWRDDAGGHLHALEGGRPPLSARSAGCGCGGATACDCDEAICSCPGFLGILMSAAGARAITARVGADVERALLSFPAGTIIDQTVIQAAEDEAAAGWSAAATNWTCVETGLIWEDQAAVRIAGDWPITVGERLGVYLQSLVATGGPDLVHDFLERDVRLAARTGAASREGEPVSAATAEGAGTRAGDEFDDGQRAYRCCWSRQRRRWEKCDSLGNPTGVPCAGPSTGG